MQPGPVVSCLQEAPGLSCALATLRKKTCRYFKLLVTEHLKIAMTTSIGLSVRETAWLLSLSESQVRYRLRIGRLSYAVKPKQVSVESVRAFFRDDPLAEVRERVLLAVLHGGAEPPRLRSRYERHTLAGLLAESACASWPVPNANKTFTIRAYRVH